ncbi:hypothetical protein [Actinomadura hibisca]|uniref:hypothetical protein n=1 Tax=Actinomadura hibisca TaxID=68565 RepID=UPI000835B805|nr:hypothetical protein [Actinomadura hibisca]
MTIFKEGVRVRWRETGKTGTCTGWWRHQENEDGGSTVYSAELDEGGSEVFLAWDVDLIQESGTVTLAWERTTVHYYEAVIALDELRDYWKRDNFGHSFPRLTASSAPGGPKRRPPSGMAPRLRANRQGPSRIRHRSWRAGHSHRPGERSWPAVPGRAVTTTPAMTTAQRIRPVRLVLSRGSDGQYKIILQGSGRVQFWDLARALAAWAAIEDTDVRDLPAHPGEQWALIRIHATMWELGLDCISAWPTPTSDNDRAAVATWACTAVWRIWGATFAIPAAELDAALNTYTDPFYNHAWTDPARPNSFSAPPTPGGALLHPGKKGAPF